MLKKWTEWIWPTFDPAKTKMLLGAALTRLKLHQSKKRELVKRERLAIKQLIADKDFEVARAKAASCIRDELLCEVFALLEILIATAKQRFQLLSMYKNQCPAELEESWHTVVFAATRTEIPEFKELTNQLMLLYGEEWGRLANVDAHGLANQRVVRKLTIFANDTLVKQYLQDVMGPEFDPEICFGSHTDIIDDEMPQNAAQMERELASLRAAASATAPLSTATPNPDNTAKASTGGKTAAGDDVFPSDGSDSFRAVSDDDDDNDDAKGGGITGGGGGEAFPEPPPDLDNSRGGVIPPSPRYKPTVSTTTTPTAPVVPTPPTSPHALPTISVTPDALAKNDVLIHQETIATPAVESAADDLLARFEALKPKRNNTPKPARVSSPTAPPPEDEETAQPEPTQDDPSTLDLLMSFPVVSQDDAAAPAPASPRKQQQHHDVTPGGHHEDLSGSDVANLMPSVPGDDDEDDGGLSLPSAPTSDLGRGIKSGSKEEKQLDEMDDLAARFERLKKGGR